MEITLSPKALEHLNFWKKSGNKAVQNKIHALIESLQTSPFEGIGQPEALKHNLAGYWSRRINKEHRLIYQVRDREIEITSLKGHY
ncbi:MAG: Txe/YoeB family addiction module toxin [Mucilaginibacter sp.]